ncbi:hypothetical protein [Albimonas pacifica]|uniref:Fenitrothion hydrolase n=1 Tax=Albimonas pacifica TaxID=1114924 RepID=A0A1I3BF98_9RHOB|nr:hypothetical protein [Albimonas pacifica]SFH60985.1 hypothetical protein SAMN05216258_10151 [Albimonas pacifica]
MLDRGFSAHRPGRRAARAAPGLAVTAAAAAAAWLAAGLAAPARAHVSEGAVALLLPTAYWIPAGAAAVAASALALALAPPAWARAAARAVRLPLPAPAGGERLLGLASALGFWALVLIGWFGPRDPLENLASLGLWCGLYILLPAAMLAGGDLWAWISPFRAATREIRARLLGGRPPPARLPAGLGMWPAALSWLLVMAFALADPAPFDPARAASAMALWWLGHVALALVFGEAWLERGEGFGAWLSLFAALAPVRAGDGRLVLRLPGAALAEGGSGALAGAGAAGFALAALGAGIFDGLNETYVWLGWIGVNPLEFPGRSAVIAESLLGMAGTVALLTLACGGCVAAGRALAGAPGPGDPAQPGLPRAFGRLGLSLVPIVAGYHVAHYIPVALVQGQYLWAALGDPLHLHWALTGFTSHEVTTSFFNHVDDVRPIWLSQAAAIVAGHVVGVFAAHAAALELFGSARRAARSQIPLAGFMVLATLLGLWLLAAPKGA